MGRRQSYQGEKLRQKKSLGQVFLNTEWPVMKVVDSLRQWDVQRVLEIGPGPGILTKALLAAGYEVTAVEKDERFVEKLEDYYRIHQKDYRGSLRIVSSDILKFDLGEWLDESNQATAVVGNIPYNISTPILTWVLPHLSRLKGVEFLVQLEFAARLAAQVGTKDYGSLSVFTQLRSKVVLECKVDRACFRPIPKVDSALVILQPKPNQLPDEILNKVELVTRASFTQRRKMLRNAIRQFLKEEMIGECPFDLNRRPDTLRPEEYVELAQFIYKHAKQS
ncbi:MAG: 16S rRNA (adenine(1518)-N(6)/adenine(1519)-N(6))-dimethyltransferase RsmA [Oligoflexus sp.]